jgi:hypothetical protein
MTSESKSDESAAKEESVRREVGGAVLLSRPIETFV